jgi:hypothetical protein
MAWTALISPWVRLFLETNRAEPRPEARQSKTESGGEVLLRKLQLRPNGSHIDLRRNKDVAGFSSPRAIARTADPYKRATPGLMHCSKLCAAPRDPKESSRLFLRTGHTPQRPDCVAGPIRSSTSGVNESWRWRHDIMSRRFTTGESTS